MHIIIEDTKDTGRQICNITGNTEPIKRTKEHRNTTSEKSRRLDKFKELQTNQALIICNIITIARYTYMAYSGPYPNAKAPQANGT